MEDLAKHQQTVGRYMLFGQIGAGGMGAVHLGRRIGPAGFSRLVAIKRLHPHLAKDKDVVSSFLDEARIAARVSHPNVVSIDDVVLSGNEVLLVMEYVKGQSLSFLAGAERKAARNVPPRIVAAIANDMLHGLQAAHEARDERGRLLGVIHRDVSPQNVLVGADGIARVLDFGIAKALGRLQTTQEGAVKGKLAYMAPERLSDRETTASVDIYGAAIVIWELLAGERYFEGPSSEALIPIVIEATYRHLREPSLAPVDLVLQRALRRDPAERHASCKELAADLERVLAPASRNEISAWVERVASAELLESEALVAEVECSSTPFPQEGRPVSQGSRTMTSRIAQDEVAPPTQPEPPSTSREPPPTRPDRPTRQGDTSTQLTSEATVSDVGRGLMRASPATTLRRNAALGTLALVIAGGLAWVAVSVARPSSLAALPSAQAPESVLPRASTSAGAAPSSAPAPSASVSMAAPSTAPLAPHAPRTGARPPAATPSASTSPSGKSPSLPDAPTDRK